MGEAMSWVIPYDDVDFVFVDNYYDLNLSGLCLYNGEIMRFETEFTDAGTFIGTAIEGAVVHVFPMAIRKKALALLRKKLFEVCVGTHWTYPLCIDGVCKSYHLKKPKWFWGIVGDLYYRFRL